MPCHLTPQELQGQIIFTSMSCAVTLCLFIGDCFVMISDSAYHTVCFMESFILRMSGLETLGHQWWHAHGGYSMWFELLQDPIVWVIDGLQVWWKQSWEYKGADGVLKGTFSLAQLSDWLKSGHLYRELMVCYFPCFPLQISFWSLTLACVQ